MPWPPKCVTGLITLPEHVNRQTRSSIISSSRSSKCVEFSRSDLRSRALPLSRSQSLLPENIIITRIKVLLQCHYLYVERNLAELAICRARAQCSCYTRKHYSSQSSQSAEHNNKHHCLSALSLTAVTLPLFVK